MRNQGRFARVWLAAGAMSLAAGAAAAQAASADRVAQAASPPSIAWHVLARDVIPGLASATPEGWLDGGGRIQVGIALADPNTAAEEAAARAVYDAGSAEYHHFFTPAQWQARFALPASTFDGAVAAATGNGLKLAYASPMRSYATLSGTVADVQRTFGVQLQRYVGPDGRHFFANVQAPTVPDGVVAVMGMESLSVQLPRNPAQSRHQTGPCVQGNCLGLVTASDLWSIYGQPSTNRGQGQKVAIIGEGDMAQPVTDLRTWEARQSPALPQVPVKQIAVANDQTDRSGLLEWNIDTQAATGMAPDAQELDLYFTQSLGVTAGAFSVWANDSAGPLQANASFGGCESLNLALGSIQAEEPMFRQAAAEGRTLFVSTGDTGGSCTVVTGNGIVNTVAPQVEWPAASNWVVAVGGTEVFASSGANPHRTIEKAWEYTGGGISLTQPEPTWQSPIPIIVSRCAVDGALAPQTNAPVCRGLPDVASMSGDSLFNQYDITSAGANNFGAGTSLSSPLWAGIWTRIQAAAPAAGLGFAAPKLYQQGLDPVADARDFFDVSIGSNGQYPALARNQVNPSGWDYVSGLGVANVANLMQDLTGALVPSNPSAPIGGGGATASSGGCGGGNGTMTAPEGNQPFPFAAASVTKVVPSYSATTSAVTVTFTVPQMSSGTQNELDFYYNFSYEAKPYQLDATYDPVQGNSFTLYDLSGTGVVTALSTALTGAFDFTAGSASITMTVAVFNSTAHPTTALAGGSILHNATANSGYEYTGYGNVISNGECPFTLA
ncbi:MAG TPA: S53 family peptidase [Candidatus Dormibacteraeota bacterium]|nr:S53 family peptidase [Candidatus Dormibacteraeota bacterium]